jgi:hypothetical protein
MISMYYNLFPQLYPVNIFVEEKPEDNTIY